MGHLTAGLALWDPWLPKLPPHLREGLAPVFQLGRAEELSAAASTLSPKPVPSFSALLTSSLKLVSFPQSFQVPAHLPPALLIGSAQ